MPHKKKSKKGCGRIDQSSDTGGQRISEYVSRVAKNGYREHLDKYFSFAWEIYKETLVSIEKCPE